MDIGSQITDYEESVKISLEGRASVAQVLTNELWWFSPPII